MRKNFGYGRIITSPTRRVADELQGCDRQPQAAHSWLKLHSYNIEGFVAKISEPVATLADPEVWRLTLALIPYRLLFSLVNMFLACSIFAIFEPQISAERLLATT